MADSSHLLSRVDDESYETTCRSYMKNLRNKQIKMADSSPLLPHVDDEPYETTCRSYMEAFVTFVLDAAGIFTMVPYFRGGSCHPLPSALPMAIAITTIGLLKGVMVSINNWHRLKNNYKPRHDCALPKVISSTYSFVFFHSNISNLISLTPCCRMEKRFSSARDSHIM